VSLDGVSEDDKVSWNVLVSVSVRLLLVTLSVIVTVSLNVCVVVFEAETAGKQTKARRTAIKSASDGR
jgi:hypothetical protein